MRHVRIELRWMRLTAASAALLLMLSGCGGDDDSPASPTVPAAPTHTGGTATHTPRATNPPATATPTNVATAAANTPTQTGTPAAVAGAYSSAIPLGGGQVANLNLTVEADGQATGTLEIVGPATTTLASARLAAVFAAAGIDVSLGFAHISGNVDPATGDFHFAGDITIAGETTTFDLSGAVPLSAGATGSVTAVINEQTYSSTIGLGSGPTPLPTQAGGPSPTPIVDGGCAHGVFDVTLSDVSSDSNLIGSGATLGKVNAIDTLDTTLNTYVWAVTANTCTPVFGAVTSAVVIQGVGVPTRIEPGTYALASATPPFIGLTYTESKFTLDPSQNFSHFWASTGGTLVIGDAGGGVLSVHIEAPMGDHPLLHSGTGVFMLVLDGTITAVNS